MVHPVCPWLYCSNIATIQGIGVGTKTAAPADIDVPSLPFYYLWEQYVFTLEFSPLPFPPLPDDEITVKPTTWTDTDGTTVTSQFTTEYNRYTDIEVLSKEEAIMVQLGQMAFRTSSLDSPGGTTFSGMPKIVLPNQLLKVKWYGVPFRYFIVPYIAKYPIRVNQTPWSLASKPTSRGNCSTLAITRFATRRQFRKRTHGNRVFSTAPS